MCVAEPRVETAVLPPCEAGARTAAPAQEAGSSTAQREKRQETVCISALDSGVWAFLPPNLL